MELKLTQEEQPESAAQTRVTAEELARAVTSIEARRAASEYPSDSITIGQAVKELSLPVTPEEVSTELQAITEREAQTTRANLTRRQTLLARGKTALLLLSVLLNLWLGYQLAVPADVRHPEARMEAGALRSIAGQSGEVVFPAPLSRAPNMELRANDYNKTAVTATTPTGFRWQFSGPDDIFYNDCVGWEAGKPR